MRTEPRSLTVAGSFPVRLLRVCGFMATILMAAPALAQSGTAKPPARAKSVIKAPDSAAVTDSLARLKAHADSTAAAQAAAAAQPPKEKKSFFKRAISSAKQASDKMESATGISAKDAALAATGVGAAGIIGKKMGVDPSAVVGNAIGSAAQKSAMKGATSIVPGVPGAPAGGAVGAALQSVQRAQAVPSMQQLAMPNMAQPAAMASGEDAQVMMRFQQEMTQVTMAATTGDPSARAKLDGWQKMSARFDVEAATLMSTAATGDASGYMKLQRMQTNVMREWLDKYSSKRTGKP